MNAFSQAQRAYSAVSVPTRTPRGTEYEAVARITHRLQAADALGQDGFSKLAEALHDNKRMWRIFATDVADPKNPLPKDLRARIFFLAEFTQVHSSKVLARTDTIKPLIEINMAILHGLRSGAA